MANKISLAWAEDNQPFKAAVLRLLREEASQLIEILFTVNNGKEMLDHLPTAYFVYQMTFIDRHYLGVTRRTLSRIRKEITN